MSCAVATACVCVRLYLRAFVSARLGLSVHARVCVCRAFVKLCVELCVCLRVYVCVCDCVCWRVCICLNVCLCSCLCVCLFAFAQISLYGGLAVCMWVVLLYVCRCSCLCVCVPACVLCVCVLT